jgi:hypothetical protein
VGWSRSVASSPLSPGEKARLASGLQCGEDGGGGHGAGRARSPGVLLHRRALRCGTGAGSKLSVFVSSVFSPSAYTSS